MTSTRAPYVLARKIAVWFLLIIHWIALMNLLDGSLPSPKLFPTVSSIPSVSFLNVYRFFRFSVSAECSSISKPMLSLDIQIFPSRWPKVSDPEVLSLVVRCGISIPHSPPDSTMQGMGNLPLSFSSFPRPVPVKSQDPAHTLDHNPFSPFSSPHTPDVGTLDANAHDVSHSYHSHSNSNSPPSSFFPSFPLVLIPVRDLNDSSISPTISHRRTVDFPAFFAFSFVSFPRRHRNHRACLRGIVLVAKGSPSSSQCA
jgi:hypothetical protein